MPDQVEVSVEDGVSIVRFLDDAIRDPVVIAQIAAEIGEAVDENESGKLLLNFENVSKMSSEMIGKLISFNKKTTLKMCNIRDELMTVFRLTGLQSEFSIFDDQDGAMSDFALG